MNFSCVYRSIYLLKESATVHSTWIARPCHDKGTLMKITMLQVETARIVSQSQCATLPCAVLALILEFWST